MKVLIVDDERQARERMARLLAPFPDVDAIGEAADGLAALESIAALHPDAVFLDVQMRAVAKLRDTGTRNGLDRL
ncbi:MAG: LytR/AlgR family response regulator transcription factor, partial [Bryobacteraceae bacterium]